MAHKRQPPSAETRLKISIANTGKIRTPEQIEKNRQAKFKNPTRYWLGKKRSPETIAKIMATKALNPYPGYWLGKKRDEKTVEAIRQAHLGSTPWNKGLVGVTEAWNKGIRYLQIAGSKNNNWKGQDVSYRNLHRWVERWLGKPDSCEHCETTGLIGRKIHWANKSREYKRELSDWIRLCVPCHKAYDKVENQIVNI